VTNSNDVTKEIRVIDRTIIPVPYTEMNATRSIFDSYTKTCSACLKPIPLPDFGLTKRIYGNTVYLYRRGECKVCRNDKIRADRHAKHISLTYRAPNKQSSE